MCHRTAVLILAVSLAIGLSPQDKALSQTPDTSPAAKLKGDAHSQRKLRLNGLGLRYEPNPRLSFDAGYRPGLSSEAPSVRGFFVGVKRRFETR
jgi:hypothetical protein